MLYEIRARWSGSVLGQFPILQAGTGVDGSIFSKQDAGMTDPMFSMMMTMILERAVKTLHNPDRLPPEVTT